MASKLKNIVCAISGGVDSCVAALLLKNRGFNVQGVFMRNWDIADESGYCQADRDKEDAEFVCRKIQIPFLEANFVKEFWNNIFSDFIQDYVNGLTPNPDILCNKKLKFDTFMNYALNKLNADAVATGHYARVLETSEKEVHLLRGVDEDKDQTFFLSQIPQNMLRKCLFPIGQMTKREVKRIASENGFQRIVNKKESTGICFIGKRKFRNFIDDYIEPNPGNFVNIENNQIVGVHKGIHCWTIGQRCLIAGHTVGYYATGKNKKNREIFVAPGGDHPGLYSQSMVTESPYWITPKPPSLTEDTTFRCHFRFQHRESLVKCLLHRDKKNQLHVFLETVLKAITPGQYAVFYQGEECLGSARILFPGPSLYQLQRAESLIS